MDRMRPVYVKQKSNTSTPGAPASPNMSPLNQHVRSTSAGVPNMRRGHNTAAKAAAQRMAHMMASQPDDDEEEDDLLYNPVGGPGGVGGIGLGGRGVRPRSPRSVRSSQDQPASLRPASRPAISVNSEQRSSSRPSIGRPSQHISSIEQSQSARSRIVGRPYSSSDSVEQPPSMCNTAANLSSQHDIVDQTQSARSKIAGRSSNSNDSVEQPPAIGSTAPTLSFQNNHAEQSQSTHPKLGIHSYNSTDSVDEPLSAHSRIAGRSQNSDDLVEQPPSARYTAPTLSSQRSNVEQFQSVRSRSSLRSYNSADSAEQPPSARSISPSLASRQNIVEQPSSARSTVSNRSFQSTNSLEQYSSARPTSHPGMKAVPMVPASVPLSLKPINSGNPSELPVESRRDRRMSLDFGSMNKREPGSQNSTSAIQDELDMVQEENESLLEKLRLAEERCEEAEARTQQLEKQVSLLGQGVSLDARLLSRKEAALQEREAALRVAEQTHGGGQGEDINTLKAEAEIARDDATSALEQLHEVEKELKVLRNVTQRLMLTQEEMEEVVLKRCWLSRYWSLCVKYGIHAEIAEARHEYWSSMAPIPSELVISAGQRAKEETESNDNDAVERAKVLKDFHKLSGERNMESMILVEKGLRELTSLKVEDAVVLAMALNRRVTSQKSGTSDELKLPVDGQLEEFRLSEEESEEVLFKQAWLTYFWRRAKNHGLEPEISDDRLKFWINQNNKSLVSHDAVEAERGLIELRKLGLETQLWGESRKGLEEGTTDVRRQTDF